MENLYIYMENIYIYMQYLTYLHGMKYGLYMDYRPLGGAVPPNKWLI